MLPLALTLGAYHGADAQTYGPYGRWEKSTRHLDVLKVYIPSSGLHHSLINMGDLSWNKGDTLKLAIAVHKEQDSNEKSWWTDDELTEYYLGEELVNATTPSRKRFHDGVITEVRDVISGKRD